MKIVNFLHFHFTKASYLLNIDCTTCIGSASCAITARKEIEVAGKNSGWPQITPIAPIDGAVTDGNVRNSEYQPVLFESSRA